LPLVRNINVTIVSIDAITAKEILSNKVMEVLTQEGSDDKSFEVINMWSKWLIQ
jgi:hypothetical protein